ncbi:MAG: WG repeat-containing protein [Prevotellaceae bacterium]|jgi:hypothetical protein|nr:WG repeat-containing protein [Prevotellaceae bacterium]
MKIKTQSVLKALIAGLFCFCVACSNSNQADLKLIPVESGDKWGYINKKGEYVINPQFQDAGFFRDGLARVVSSDGKTGYIKEDGKYAIPAKFKSGTHFAEGLAFVVSDGSYPVCIDKSGETKFSLKQAKYAVSFSEGLAMIVTADGKYGFVDKSGKTVINPQFESANSFSEGLAAIEQNNKCGFIDKTGKIVINPQFDEVRDFKNGKAVFHNGKQYGYIDSKGSYAINPQFDHAGNFSEGMAVVKSGKEYGYITESGKIEINPQFDNADVFQSGLAVIEQGERYGYINKQGKIEINPQFDNASAFFGNIALVENADKWGIIDKKGKYIVNPQFDAIKYIFETTSYVHSDYYDASAFINKFFEKAGGDNTFDGFTAESTLQNIIDNPLYGNVNAHDKYIAYTNDNQEITNEIYVTETQFHFVNAIYENVSADNEYSGYRYETGSTKQYNFSEKFSTIEYEFDLSGEAYGKGSAVAAALKAEIEKRYNVKMESKVINDNITLYTAYQDNGLSFIVGGAEKGAILFISFNKDNLQSVITNELGEIEGYEGDY